MNFQLKHNLLITIFIIVIIASVGFLMKDSFYAFWHSSNQKSNTLTINKKTAPEAMAYIEKIDKFALQEFDENQKLSHFVTADSYFNFKNSPALLINPQVTTYDKNGKSNHMLKSKRANYLDSGEVRFTGQVDISSSNGIAYKMNTQELLVDTNTDDLTSHKEVTYLGEKVKIIAQGMYMKTKDNKMQLTGDAHIIQNSGQNILTKDLYIDESNNQKHYYSDNKTTYLSTANKIYAEGVDMNMQTELTQLLGKVNIVQTSGATIKTNNLTLDQANGQEIYRTDGKIHYQSNVADIKATGMNYDVIQQKIKFSGGVEGRYD
jgi:LPS export ABC transporter protein LptC